MTVYVDRTHKKFKNVIDDPEYNHICIVKHYYKKQ